MTFCLASPLGWGSEEATQAGPFLPLVPEHNPLSDADFQPHLLLTSAPICLW